MQSATIRSRRLTLRPSLAAVLTAIGGLLAALALAPNAAGVVVADSDEMSVPIDGYVGSWNGSSAVCIGPNWIISAKHVGGTVGHFFSMRGVQYRAVEIVQHPVQDIELIRVAEALPGYHHIATDVEPGDIGILGGWGVTAGGAYNNGYEWTGPRRETWGANIIEGVGSLMSIRFDDPATPAAVPHEAIYAVNDSGAGLFVVGIDGSLELAGVAVSVTGFGTSAYGSWAFSINLSALRSWIMPIANPGAPITSSIEAPRASVFTGGAPSVVWAAAVIGGVAFGRRRRELPIARVTSSSAARGRENPVDCDRSTGDDRMRPILTPAYLLVSLLLTAGAAGVPAQPADPKGSPDAALEVAWTPLFNGHDLSGWSNVNCGGETWSVRDGMIVCSGHPTGLLRSEKMYENFVLELEFRHLHPGGNSGLFIMSDALPVRGQPFTRAIEVQVMDGAEGEWYTSDGDIFPIHGASMTPENPRPKGGSRAFPTEKRMKPSPEWNHYRVECRNGEVSLAVNGKVVTRGHACRPQRGYFCLESEGSEVHFRNIRVKELPVGTPPLAFDLVATADEGFRPLFGGDFSGWKHGPAHKDHWTVDDWTIAFDGEGEDLWTEQSFRDFVLIADWRWTSKPEDAPETAVPVILPDGTQAKAEDGTPKTQNVRDAGDSGIYLRGNSKSQVNIWCWPVGSGEVYGYRTDAKMPPEVRAGVTPKTAADAPIGQWNRFEITMKGDRLTVVLNGKTVIQNAQLPGVAAEGPIALQKHGGRIQFGNLYLKELK